MIQEADTRPPSYRRRFLDRTRTVLWSIVFSLIYILLAWAAVTVLPIVVFLNLGQYIAQTNELHDSIIFLISFWISLLLFAAIAKPVGKFIWFSHELIFGVEIYRGSCPTCKPGVLYHRFRRFDSDFIQCEECLACFQGKGSHLVRMDSEFEEEIGDCYTQEKVRMRQRALKELMLTTNRKSADE